MVAVDADHVADIRIDPFAENWLLVIPELPARYLHQGEQSQFIAGVHKGGVDHVMRADHLHPRIAQLLCIAPLHGVGQCVPEDGKILVAVRSHQFALVTFPVDPQSIVLFKLDAPDTDSLAVPVHHLPLHIPDPDVQVIQVRIVRAPQMRFFHLYRTDGVCRLSFPHGYLFLDLPDNISLLVLQLERDGDALSPCRAVTDVGFQVDDRTFFRHIGKGDEQAAARHFVFIIRIRDEHIIVCHQPAVAVDTAEIGEVQHVLRLPDGIKRIIAIVCLDGNHIFLSPLQRIRHIHDDGQVATVKLFHQLAVYIHLAFAHDGFEVQEQLFALQLRFRRKTFAVPGDALVVGTSARLVRQVFQAVRHGDDLPGPIVETDRIGFPLYISFHESPGKVHRIGLTSRIGQFVKSCC